MRPQFQKLANFLRIAKISPVFKEAEVLPWRLPNVGKANSFVILTIKLSYFLKHVWIKLWRENNFGWLVQFGALDGGTKSFFTRSI